MLTSIIKLTLRLIKTGAEDEKIKEEYVKAQKKGRKGKGIDSIFSTLLCLVLCVVFAFSLWVGFSGNSFSYDVPTLRVVNSASMSKKHEKNTYLVENNLNDHIQTFDLIFTYKAPAEFDLKIYDIVVYEVDGTLIVHRIVNIEEPNSKHPDERWFLCQGDAVERPDRFPVRYSQIKGIYRGQRIPFVGSFVSFMQSPAGWLCVLLVVTTTILTPILERKIKKARHARYLLICPTIEVALAEQVIKKVNFDFDKLGDERDTRTFEQKLADSTDIVKERYSAIDQSLRRIVGARIIEGKKHHTYKSGNVAIARLNFRGKTLNVHLGLNPKEYEDSKYIYTDVSDIKAYANYPMRVKLSSDRQTRWSKELIEQLRLQKGLELVKVNPFAHLEGKRDNRTFDQKLDALPIAKERFEEIQQHLNAITGVRVIEGKKAKTYKKGNVPIVRFAVRGKTLNAYIGLDPKKHMDSKYVFKDVSSMSAYANYPMRVKVTSNRQVRWVKELISAVLSGATDEN